jgi:hypothetical protein
MRIAAAKADVYANAMHNYLDRPTPVWRWVRRLRHHVGYRRAERRCRLYADEAERLARVVTAYVAAHSITAGPSRGPVIPGTTDHRPGNPARAGGTTTPL